MIIYGWGKDLKEVAYAGIDKCQQCKNWSHFHICEHSSHASLYFVKVLKWNKRCVYVCQTCSHGWAIDESKKDDIIRQTISLPSKDHCALMWNRFDQAVSQAIDQGRGGGEEAMFASVRLALTNTIGVLKQTFQEDHTHYLAQRYVAYLQDQDRPK
jgi:hypothetical protein